MASIRETIMNKIYTTLTDYKETGELVISDVSRFDEDVLQEHKWKSPMIMIDDQGDDELRVQDSTHYRYRATVILRGFIHADTATDVQPLLNRMISTIKQYIDSVPALGTNVLSFQYLNNQASRFDKDSGMADCLVNVRLTYCCASGAF